MHQKISRKIIWLNAFVLLFFLKENILQKPKVNVAMRKLIGSTEQFRSCSTRRNGEEPGLQPHNMRPFQLLFPLSLIPGEPHTAFPSAPVSAEDTAALLGLGKAVSIHHKEGSLRSENTSRLWGSQTSRGGVAGRERSLVYLQHRLGE